LNFSEIKNPKVKDLIARLVRVKLLHWDDWYKILDKEDEFWEKALREALSTPARYSWTDKKEITYYYYLKLGGERFLIVYDSITDKVKVFGPLVEGQRIDFEKDKPFLSLPRHLLEEYKEE